MKIDKEYPATHSMSTSWYIVDDDGNVGIMDYNENGPVPWGIEQTNADELKYGHWDDWKTAKILKFNLTDEQILDLLHEPHTPSTEEMWYDCAVKIDKEKTSRFLDLCNNPDIVKTNVFCISERLAIYEFDAYDCAHNKDYEKTEIHGTLKTMLDEDIIIEVYKTQNLDTNDYYADEEIVHEAYYDNSPYYMFHQPYWPEFLPKKMYEPTHPVKINQIPQEFQYRLHKIPGRFKDMDTLQIAQYYPCYAYSNGDPIYIVDGCTYESFPLPNGSKIYTKTDMCNYQFFPFCSEKKRFKCNEKNCKSCCDIRGILTTDKPMVMIIFSPKENADHLWNVLSDIIKRKSFCISYIPKFPYKKNNANFYLKCQVEKYMTRDYLSHVFKGSNGYIENIIKDINPRVILATDAAFDIIKTVYATDSNCLKTDGMEYPFYKQSAINENIGIIEDLAKQPYQGKEHPLVISLEGMNQLVEQGRAINYKDLYD